jgi:hypothetical protein
VTKVGLPDWLGGGEGEAPDTDGEVVRVTKYGPDEEMAVVVIQREHLTGLLSEIPDEPPVGAVVLVDADVLYQRLDDHPMAGVQTRWYGADDWFSWAEICHAGTTPVRLVPDPAVNVELPWESLDNADPRAHRSTVHEFAGSVQDYLWSGEEQRGVMVKLTPNAARAKAAALIAAADAAEKETP